MRRSGVFVAAAVLSLVLAGCDWPMFGFNAAQTRFTPDTSIGLSAVVSGSANRAWTGVTSGVVESSSAVANGKVYVTDDDHKLYAFDAAGTTNCSGSPKTCAPLWTATLGGTIAVELSSPAVINGVVYVGSEDDKLYAFDAAGTTNCSGSPKTCAPLWTATTGGSVESSPTVANGVVYVGSDDHKIYAFDAAGTTNCSGTPKTCTPLWTATTRDLVRASPAVGNGTLFVGSTDGTFSAFDAAGTTNCSGTPKTCTPLWTTITPGSISGIAVASGMVYVGSGSLLPNFGKLTVFDASIKAPCDPNPNCPPLWTAGLSTKPSSPAVANGVIYIGEFGGPLFAFDAAGKTGCVDDTCAPLWIADIGGRFTQDSSPAVANGVVYIGTGVSSVVGLLNAFDAAGTTNCSGTPRVCNPVWTSDNLFVPIRSSPAVANGYVYIGGSLSGGIAAFHFG